jgi:hypothetical protein
MGMEHTCSPASCVNGMTGTEYIIGAVFSVKLFWLSEIPVVSLVGAMNAASVVDADAENNNRDTHRDL